MHPGWQDPHLPQDRDPRDPAGRAAVPDPALRPPNPDGAAGAAAEEARSRGGGRKTEG